MVKQSKTEETRDGGVEIASAEMKRRRNMSKRRGIDTTEGWRVSAGCEGHRMTKGTRKRLIVDHCSILTYFTRAQA